MTKDLVTKVFEDLTDGDLAQHVQRCLDSAATGQMGNNMVLDSHNMYCATSNYCPLLDTKNVCRAPEYWGYVKGK